MSNPSGICAESYDPATNEWHSLPDFVSGEGRHTSSACSAPWLLLPVPLPLPSLPVALVRRHNALKSRLHCPGPRWGAACTAVGQHQLAVVGGVDADGEFLAATEFFAVGDYTAGWRSGPEVGSTSLHCAFEMTVSPLLS